MKLRVLDLFSGIGGFSLGLERTGGFETVAFCEIDPFCQRVLRKHWTDVPIYDDVRALDGSRIAADVITGGFPCQDISLAGKGAGLAGERSGLWSEIARLIGEIRPRYAILENVSALLGRGLGDVLGDLAALGYDAEWHCIPASYVGAPHGRDRIWILAYPNSRRGRADPAGGHDADRADPGRAQTDGLSGAVSEQHGRRDVEPVADSHGVWGLQQQGVIAEGWRRTDDRHPASPEWARYWPEVLSEIQGVDDGVSTRLDKAACDALGNTVVPQIPEIIGRAILSERVRRGA